MRLVLTLVLLLLLLACVNSSEKESYSTNINESKSYLVSDSLKRYVIHDESLMVFVNATIIDGTGKEAISDQSFIVKDGVFNALGKRGEVAIPPNAKILDLRGKTVIPGIVGVHNHLHIPGYHFIGDVAAKLYLASGLTTIQTCGAASPFLEIELAKQIENQEKIGPDIVTTAPYISGPGASRVMIIPTDAQHIRDTMAFWLEQGVKWFKVYRHTRPEDLKVIVEVAHKNQAKVTGHFCSITFEEAINIGVDGIEHGLNSAADFRTEKDYGFCNGGRSYMDELDISSEKVKALHQLMIDSSVFMNSTLSIYESSIPERAFADERTLKAMSPDLIQQYEERRRGYAEKEQTIDRLARLKRIMAFEYQFFQMGGLLGAGVDPGRHNMPGYGDQRNYELLIEAGFAVEEAIQIMTGNGAKILGREDIGTIQVGKRADFVVLDGNLGLDSSVIRNVEVVFKEGIGFNPDRIIKETHGQVGL